MEVAKTFDRAGVRYRPGDSLPEGLDKQTLEHYKRYGMVREVRTPGPVEKKPAEPGKNTGASPRKRADPKPGESKNATGTDDGVGASAVDSKLPDGGQQVGGEQQPADGQQSAPDAAGQQTSGDKPKDVDQK